MKTLRFFLAVSSILALGLACGGSKSQGSPYAESAGRIDDATAVLESMLKIPDKAIPEKVLQDARGIAVIPGVVKASAIFGGGKGLGVMSVRRNDGSWSYPSFITTEAHSIGWQLGIEKVDLVLVFRTSSSIQKTLQNELTLGGTVSAAAGPLGRYASASTNSQVNSEIYSYARASGLFVGASLDGSVFHIDNGTNATFYGAKYIPANDIFQNKVPAQANLDVVKRFDSELDRISKATPADTTRKAAPADTTGR